MAMSFLACAVALLHLLSTAPIVPVDARPEKFPDDLWCSVCKLTMKHAAKEVWDERRSKKAVRKVLEDDFCEKMLEGLENVPPPIGIGVRARERKQRRTHAWFAHLRLMLPFPRSARTS
mmetsp:Transcript_55163/g.175476  ORF Transcript_55163/g.175476 Transcript_55163/m.175476 type:complete len:119 (-) Transcript_55163:807-1163(-)